MKSTLTIARRLPSELWTGSKSGTGRRSIAKVIDGLEWSKFPFEKISFVILRPVVKIELPFSKGTVEGWFKRLALEFFSADNGERLIDVMEGRVHLAQLMDLSGLRQRRG